MPLTSALSASDSLFLKYLRGFSIFIIVFGHVGGFWIFPPYSSFLLSFPAVFFFVSGAVSYFSFLRRASTKHYLAKRIISLFIPYYLLCLVSLAVFFYLNKRFPEFNMYYLFRWLTLIPGNDLMPFPIGQIWFLHSLAWITLVSPIFFLFHQKKNMSSIFVIFVILGVSTVQGFQNIADGFRLFGRNLYSPFLNLLFFLLGCYVFSSRSFFSFKWLIGTFSLSLIACIVFVSVFNFPVDYTQYHPSDIYYVMSSIAILAVILLSKPLVLIMVSKVKVFQTILNFLFVHTFSFFLVHGFAIYLSETVFSFCLPTEKNLAYGIIKLVLVLMLTSLISIPFSHTSSFLLRLLLKNIQFASTNSKSME